MRYHRVSLTNDLLHWKSLLTALQLNGLVQLLPGAPHYEDAHQERDDQLDQEDQPAGQHVLRAGQHLLHAAESRPYVDVECLGGDEADDAGHDVSRHG